MTAGESPSADSPASSPWYWYVLLGYPVASLLGILALARLTAGGSVVSSSFGGLALVILLTAFGIVSVPAIGRDAAFVREAGDEWEPGHQVYVGGAIAPPVVLAVLGGLVAGFGVAVALLVSVLFASTVAANVAYLYNRHRTIGLLAR